jgi:hypothetical protein
MKDYDTLFITQQSNWCFPSLFFSHIQTLAPSIKCSLPGESHRSALCEAHAATPFHFSHSETIHSIQPFSTNHRMSRQLLLKPSKWQHTLMSKRKKVNDPVWPKDIFCTIWPDGYESNPLYYGPEGDGNGFYTNQQPVFVLYPKCATHLFSSSMS